MANVNHIKVDEILRHLRSRVEDTTDLGFTLQQKLDALDSAQRYLCSVVHNNYLMNLEFTDECMTNNIGIIDITSLTHKVFRNDILSITTMQEGYLTHLDKIEQDDLSRMGNYYMSGNIDYKMWWLFGGKIHIYPTHAQTLVNISYIKEPKMFHEDETSTNNIDGDCDLDMILIDPLLDFAESYLWKIDNKPNRVKLAFELGQSAVELLNNRYAQERTTGLGQIGQRNT